MFQKLLTLINLLKSDQKIIQFVFRKAFSISSFTTLNSLNSYFKNINTILDVGANKGQFALAASYFYPLAKIYSFEPLPNLAKQLAENMKGYKNIITYNFALGSEINKLPFFENKYSLASSFLSISKSQKKLFPKTSDVSITEVEVQTLDFVGNNIELLSPLLLKLDVQGYEKEVILGAKNFINKVDFLLFETSFTMMYENEPLFDELHQLVSELGFRIVAPIGFLKADNQKIVQMDILYKRNS